VSCVKLQFKIRKEALIGLGQIYRRCCENDNSDDIRNVSWIRNKVLHAYYHSSVDDKYLSSLTYFTHIHCCHSFCCAVFCHLWFGCVECNDAEMLNDEVISVDRD